MRLRAGGWWLVFTVFGRLLAAMFLLQMSCAAAQSPVSSASGQPASAEADEGPRAREFEEVEFTKLVRLLALRARINLVTSQRVVEKRVLVTLRLEEASALETIEVVCLLQGFLFTRDGNVYYISDPQERLEAMRDLASPELGRVVAAFRARLHQELLLRGFTSEEALELLQLDQVLPSQLQAGGSALFADVQRIRGASSGQRNGAAEIAPPEEDERRGEPKPGATPRSAPSDRSVARQREYEGIAFPLLARQLATEARVNIVLSDRVRQAGDTVVIRLEETTALDTLKIVCTAKDYRVEQHGIAYFVFHGSERREQHYLEDENRAVALAAYRGVQLRELMARGFSRAQALTVLKADRFEVEKLEVSVPSALPPAPTSTIDADPPWPWSNGLLLGACLQLLLAALALVRWGDRLGRGQPEWRGWPALVLLVPAAGLLYLFLRAAPPPLPPPLPGSGQ